MQKKQDTKRTYTVGLVSGLVHQMKDHKRGDVLEVSQNEWAIYTSNNRAVLLCTSDEKADEREAAVKQFKDDIAAENKAANKAA